MDATPGLFDRPAEKRSAGQRMFDGESYEPAKDAERLGTQLVLVQGLMADGAWRTICEIRERLGKGTEQGISARLRDLRKERFGGHTVERRRRGDSEDGLYEYRLVLHGRGGEA